MADTETKTKKTKEKQTKTIYALPDGTALPYKGVDKFFRDIIRHHNGVQRWEDIEKVTVPSAQFPLGERPLVPGPRSPICAKCGLDTQGARNPYMDYAGSTNPVATIIMESVSGKEDNSGSVCSAGFAALLVSLVLKYQKEHGVALRDIRWVPLTRCAARQGKMPNYKTKGNWCRFHLIQDLIQHPPKVIIPVGTAALGLLSHKTSAQDWTGRLLTWRGWPDDWLTDPDYVLERPDPNDPAKTIKGHPLFGPVPTTRIPLVPLQRPGIVYADKNPKVIARWIDDLIYALEVGNTSIKPSEYQKPWYRISVDPNEIIKTLKQVATYAAANPDFLIAYDTETTGLKQWAYYRKFRIGEVMKSADPQVVFLMFRWKNPQTGEPESIGFPWDYPESEIYPHMAAITPYVLKVLSTATIVGHNLTFDELFTIATIGKQEGEFNPFLPDGSWNPNWLALQKRINALCSKAVYDTWHMAFTCLQKRGSLGLEILAYEYVPDLAGYEEDMTLLIRLHGDKMNPANEKGGHYAMCPKPLWESHLKPYVMGDVETTYRAYEALSKKLESTQRYKIPLSNPTRTGSFRFYETPSRAWVYKNIVSPASRTLTKMMARGMYIDPDELSDQEHHYPQLVDEAKEKLRKADPIIVRWCDTKLQEAEKEKNTQTASGEDAWELDLENKSQLKELLFDILRCPIQRLTNKGRELFGETQEKWDNSGLSYDDLRPYAAVDKYTLNKLAVDHPTLRPLQEYRKVFKLYSTYVRPMRNMEADHDKRRRAKEPHLSVDQCIHASFMLTGTRGGRLSCRDPNLQQLPNEGFVKRLFSSRFKDKGCIYASDLSQIELRLMAAACGDESMVHAYLNDIDIHSLTASKITWQGGQKIPYEHFTKKYMEELQRMGKSDKAKALELKRKIAKCVDPDTLISLNGKICRIGSVHPGREPDTFYPIGGLVQGPYGNVPLKHFYSNGVKDRLLVCSRHGLVACSTEHPFMLKTGALKKAKDLKPGDDLADPITLKSSETLSKINFCPFGIEPRDEHFQINVDENLAYLLGMFYGDGCSNLGEISIVTGGTPEFFEWQDIIAESIKKAGFEPTIYRTLWDSSVNGPKIIKSGSRADKEIHRAYGLINIGSTRISDIFAQLGAVENTPKRKRTLKIPEWLLNSTCTVKLAFLAGWIDTVGSCVKTDSLWGITKSWTLAQDLMVLMDSCGVQYSFEPSWNKTYHHYYFRLNLSAATSWNHFAGKLRHPAKRAKIHKPHFVYKIQRPNTVSAIIPLAQGPLVDIEVNTTDHLFICNSSICRNTVNFLTGYGGGAFGLQNVLANAQVYMSIEECEEIIESFFAAYPALKRFLGVYKSFIEDHTVAVSMFGRVRYFEEVHSENHEIRSKALRAGCNHLIQSTASDMMLICLFTIEALMREASLNSLLVSTVHDSLVIDAVRSELPEVHSIVNGVMNNIPTVVHSLMPDYDTSWMNVPFAGDSEVGLNYLETNKVSGDNPDWDELLLPPKKKR